MMKQVKLSIDFSIIGKRLAMTARRLVGLAPSWLTILYCDDDFPSDVITFSLFARQSKKRKTGLRRVIHVAAWSHNLQFHTN